MIKFKSKIGINAWGSTAGQDMLHTVCYIRNKSILSTLNLTFLPVFDI